MIHVIAVITAKPGMRDAVLREFRANMPAVHAEQGCVEYAPAIDAEGIGSFQTAFGPDTFVAIEKWESAEALKAHAAAEASGLPAVADDSGLAVDVLHGAPGIFSARWAGRHGDDTANLELLLAQLGDIPDEHRAAGFVCAAALVTPEGAEHLEFGHLRGTLLHEPVGDGGFGYDPVLRPDGLDVSCAQLDPEHKNRISHRGQAIEAITPMVAGLLGLKMPEEGVGRPESNGQDAPDEGQED